MQPSLSPFVFLNFLRQYRNKTEMEPSRLVVMVLVTNMSPALASSVTSLLGSSFGVEVLRQNRGWNDDPHGRFIGYGSNSSTSSSSNGMELGVKRQLIDFPDDAIMGFYFKLVVPYWSLPKVSTKGDYRVEITYELPNSLGRRRKKRTLDIERSSIYALVQDLFSKAGMDGASCVLRAVCEVGEAPLDEYGLLGELITLVFAPGFRPSEEHQDHIQAEQYGRSYGSCWSAYPDCPISMREQLYTFFINNANIAENNSS
ncbi:hypothetical protein O3P69_020957 [Scylla paramamosain]|uniref:Uncharacterized protein n=2 Tax=Scylla paramamosain TaxID=85552 RepID=A0AAW0SGI0_SCYPA